MSLDCRILRRITDGNIQYYYRNSGVTPSAVELFDTFEDVPEYIRGYFNKAKIQDVGPDFARFLGIQNKLYPNFPNCGNPDYLRKRCIAEACKYAPNGDWTKCQYFKQKPERNSNP